jgi:hypothetical protein
MPDADIRLSQGLAPLATAGDIAALLPPGVPRKKFKTIRESEEDYRQRRIRLSGRRTSVMEAVRESEDQLAAMTLPIGRSSRGGHSGRGLAEDASEVRKARQQLESLREDLARLNALYKDSTGAELKPLLGQLENFVRGRRTFQLARQETPPVRKGETIQSAIENRRRRLRELAADRESVGRAPWPSSVTKAKAREQFAALAVRGRPDVFELVERGGPVGLPTLPVFPGAEERPPVIRDMVDAAALIAWALGPTLVDAIEREIDELSDDARALTAEQRREKLNEIAADMLAVEREEEALIEVAEGEGLAVLRRLDADPRAVLGIV